MPGACRRWTAVPAHARAAFAVVIVGAGMSGVLAGIRLGQAGIPYTIIEKNPGVGGTWYENRFPGSRVDVGNHFYCYSFAPDDGWTEFFAQQPELQRYFERCVEEFGVADHIRFGTEVVGARWDDEAARWSVEVRQVAGDGVGVATETLEANALISAVGQLNRPKLPDIPGRDSFEGLAMHSAQWVDGTDLRRQARRRHRHRCERVPDRPHHRSRRRAAHGVPALRPLDVPEPALPRPRRAGRHLGLAAPPVLRPVVPVPALLARVRRRPPRHARRPRLASPGPGGQRGERPRTRVLHQLDGGADRRRRGAARQGGARLRVPRQAHPPGQRQLAHGPHAATTSSWSPTRSRPSPPQASAARAAPSTPST